MSVTGWSGSTTKDETMNKSEAVMIAEGVQEADEDTQIEAWQVLIDTGMAWSLQGSFGRQAAAMIESGVCHA
jgi:hypothetical protein